MGPWEDHPRCSKGLPWGMSWEYGKEKEQRRLRWSGYPSVNRFLLCVCQEIMHWTQIFEDDWNNWWVIISSFKYYSCLTNNVSDVVLPFKS